MADVTGLGVGAVLGGVLAFLLRTWLVKLCKVQLERLYTPLTQSLADADALTAYCRVKVAAEFKEERKKIAARRDEDLRSVEHSLPQGVRRRREPPRRKTPQDQRRSTPRQMVEVQTTREREMRERHRRPRPPHGRAQGDVRDRLPQARRKIQGVQGTDPL